MANVIPYAFRGELLTGTHNFASGGDSFKLALYTSNPYNTSSTVYVATNEVSSSGTNYTATGNAVGAATAGASCDFADTTWTSATITATHAALYNDDQSDKLCVILDFGGSFTCTNGTFKVSFPSPSTAADAIISMA